MKLKLILITLLLPLVGLAQTPTNDSTKLTAPPAVANFTPQFYFRGGNASNMQVGFYNSLAGKWGQLVTGYQFNNYIGTATAAAIAGAGTTYTAGYGLGLTGTQFRVDTATLSGKYWKLIGGNTATGFQNIWDGSSAGLTLGYGGGSAGLLWNKSISSKLLSNAGLWLYNNYTALNAGGSGASVEIDINGNQKISVSDTETYMLNDVLVTTTPYKNNMPLRWQDTTIFTKVGSAIKNTQTRQVNSDYNISGHGQIGGGLIVGDSITVQTDTVIIDGDSNTLGTCCSSITYPGVWGQRVNMTVVNNAANGATLQHSGGSNSVEDRLSLVPTYRPTIRYYAAMGGTNDLDGNLTIAGFTTAWNTIIANLVSKGYPKNRIVVLSPVLMGANAYGKNRDSIYKYVQAAEAVAKANSVRYIDVFRYMVDHGAGSLLIADSIHLNNAGQLSVADALTYGLSGGIKAAGPIEAVNGDVNVLNGSVNTNGIRISGNLSKPSWGLNGIQTRVQDFSILNNSTSSGTISDQAIHVFGIPALTASSATTITNSYNVIIKGNPVSSTNISQSRSFAFGVEGRTYIAGPVQIGDKAPFGSGEIVQVTGDVKVTGQYVGAGTGLSGTAPSLSIGGNAATATNSSTVTTNANLTGPITSVGNATSVASQTGTGSTFVMNNTPTLVTPDIGAATGTSLVTSGIVTAGGNLRTNGTFGIGAAPNANQGITLSPTYTSASPFGIRFNPVLPSTTTSNMQAYFSQPSLAAGSYTLNNLIHYNAAQGSIGAGAAITSQYGYWVDSGLSGAANNYGVYSFIPTGVNNNWNIYALGTAPNYFNGNSFFGANSYPAGSPKVGVTGSIGSTALTASQLVATDANKVLVSVTALPSGTTAPNNLQANPYSTSSTPSVSVGAAAGTGGTATIIGGTNQAMRIQVVAGTALTNGTLCTVTLSGGFAYPTTCVPVVTNTLNNSGSAFALGTQIMTTSTSSTFTLNVQGTVLTTGNTYVFDVVNSGY